MNSLALLVFVMCVGCATAGIVVDLITETAARENGFEEGTAYGREDTNVFRSMGAFAMELVPFENSQGVTQTHIRLLWRNNKMTYYTLELIKMNWPSGSIPTVAVAKGSIRPIAIDSSNNQLTVKYLKEKTYINKIYSWISWKYVGGAFTERNIKVVKLKSCIIS